MSSLGVGEMRERKKRKKLEAAADSKHAEIESTRAAGLELHAQPERGIVKWLFIPFLP